MKKIIAAVLLTGFLGACASEPLTVEPLPEITFKHLDPMIIDVASVVVEDRSKRTAGVTYVGHRFKTSPRQAVENWVRDRLSAQGAAGIARVIVNEASAIEEKLEKTEGIRGFITDDQSEKYTTKLDVRIEFEGLQGAGTQFVNAIVTRHVTIQESATLKDRELAWFALVEGMMQDFDNRISANMNEKILNR